MSTLKKLAFTAAAVAVVAYRMKGSKNAPVAAKARMSKLVETESNAEPTAPEQTAAEPVAEPMAAEAPTKAKTQSKSKARRAKAKARAAKHAA